MKSIVVVLDPAHGVDVLGKASPDGSHREYAWSRARCKELKNVLIARGYEVYFTTTSEREPGLTYRKNVADHIRSSSTKLLLSLHNNAKGNGKKWLDARGAAVYTTRGVTKSDTCAKMILARWRKDFPEIRIRRYSNKPLQEDFEENFTVLMGGSYMGCLLEWLFQDNKDDVVLLKDPSFNERFVNSLADAVDEINDYFK